MAEEEKEKARKVKEILASKKLKELLQESEVALSKKTTSIARAQKPAETIETLEQLKRKRKRLEKAL